MKTQTRSERMALAQCRKQELKPIATTPEGDVIAQKRGRIYVSLSIMPSPLTLAKKQAAWRYLCWMLKNCERVTSRAEI